MSNVPNTLPVPTFSLCVYCGSRPGHEPAYSAAAQAVGRWIGAHGGQLVYGGGRTGLMGQVAEATRLAGGRVVGIIPQALVDREVANPLCDELHVVANMHQRKAMMAERSHAFWPYRVALAPLKSCSKSGHGASSATTTNPSAS